MMSVLGPILTITALEALGGIDSTVLASDPEVAIEATDTRFVEARWQETVIRGRPWVPHRRLATVAQGTRLVVRGEVASRDDAGCHGKPWFAVLPFGFVCSEQVRTTDEPPPAGLALPVEPGHRLPFAYAQVRHDGAASYANAEAAASGLVDRELTRGMSLVVRRSVDVGGIAYVETEHGKLVARTDVGWMGQGSPWQGVRIEDAEPGPLFAWTRREPTKVRSRPDAEAEVVQTHPPRERVPLLEADGDWRRIGPDAWARADDLNEVWIVDPPEGVVSPDRVALTGNDQWVDVDTGEQVLVAYRGADPVYATLVSSGRGFPTPLGNYPVWAKVASMDMSNQDYEDKPYMVQGVPWVLLFQGHNALHGAYWHDRFGNRKSHGCVNLSPLDARWMFQWMTPSLPLGWTGYLPTDLHRAPVVHVHDSSKPPGKRFIQQRPWGPPDTEEERRRLEEAEQRRALAAAAAAREAFGMPDPPGLDNAASGDPSPESSAEPSLPPG